MTHKISVTQLHVTQLHVTQLHVTQLHVTQLHVTQLQRDNALEALNNMWPSIKPEQVIRGLTMWRENCYPYYTRPEDKEPNCGTAACFGGWCTTWPAFRAQGLTAEPVVGSPSIGNYRGIGSAYKLFGYRPLFEMRGYCDWDAEPGANALTDHELVTYRLKRLLECSEVTA